MNPIYYMFEKFFDFEKHKGVTGGRKYSTLPSMDDVVVNRENLKNFISIGMPESMLAASVSGVRFLDTLDGLRPAFFDIEFGENKKFAAATIVEDGILKSFSDPLSFLRELKKNKLLVGFECFYKLHTLMKLFPKEFYYQTIDGFEIPILPNALVLDMFYFYQLWKPYDGTHTLTELAKLTGYECEREDYADSAKRCEQDARIIESAWRIVPPIFSILAKLVNCDWYYLQNVKFNKLRRMIMFQHHLDDGRLVVSYPKNRNTEEAPKPFMLVKRGFYDGAYMYDLKNAYPTTACNLRLGIYAETDFSDIERKILAASSDDEYRKTVKYLANSFFGDQRDRNNPFRNETNWLKIMVETERQMREWAERHEDITIFSHTDSLILSKDVKPEIGNYRVELKHEFDWLIIYNHTRYIGSDAATGDIVRAGFRRPEAMPRVKIFDIIDTQAESYMLSKDWRVIEDRGKDAKQPDAFKMLIPRLDKLPKEDLAITVFKKDETCTDPKMWLVWDSLPRGFSTLFVGPNGYTTDFNDVVKGEFKEYLKAVYPYVRMYVLNDLRPGTGKDSTDAIAKGGPDHGGDTPKSTAGVRQPERRKASKKKMVAKKRKAVQKKKRR